LRRREVLREERRRDKKAKRVAAGDKALKPKKVQRKKKEGKEGKNFRRKVRMNKHKKILVKALHSNN